MLHTEYSVNCLHKGPYMSAQVFIKFINEFRKINKSRALLNVLSFCHKEFNN